MRQTGDYDDLSDWTGDEIRPMIEVVKSLISKIKGLIEQ